MTTDRPTLIEFSLRAARTQTATARLGEGRYQCRPTGRMTICVPLAPICVPLGIHLRAAQDG